MHRTVYKSHQELMTQAQPVYSDSKYKSRLSSSLETRSINFTQWMEFVCTYIYLAINRHSVPLQSRYVQACGDQCDQQGGECVGVRRCKIKMLWNITQTLIHTFTFVIHYTPNSTANIAHSQAYGRWFQPLRRSFWVNIQYFLHDQAVCSSQAIAFCQGRFVVT